MKLHKYISALCLATLALASCEKDGDTIYANGITDTELGTQASDIVLDADRLDALVCRYTGTTTATSASATPRWLLPRKWWQTLYSSPPTKPSQT